MKGEWAFKGQIGDSTNKWAIDGSVFENKGQLYMIWAGWEGDENGQQNIYIAKMKDPTTVSGQRVKISSPEYQWEKYGDLHDDNNPAHVNVNEGPEILKHKNQAIPDLLGQRLLDRLLCPWDAQHNNKQQFA